MAHHDPALIDTVAALLQRRSYCVIATVAHVHVRASWAERYGR